MGRETISFTGASKLARYDASADIGSLKLEKTVMSMITISVSSARIAGAAVLLGAEALLDIRVKKGLGCCFRLSLLVYVVEVGATYGTTFASGS